MVTLTCPGCDTNSPLLVMWNKHQLRTHQSLRDSPILFMGEWIMLPNPNTISASRLLWTSACKLPPVGWIFQVRDSLTETGTWLTCPDESHWSSATWDTATHPWVTHKLTESSFLSYFSEGRLVLSLADNLSAEATLTLGGNICLHLVPGGKLQVFMREENIDEQQMCDIYKGFLASKWEWEFQE